MIPRHVELEKSCFTCIISFPFIFPTQCGVVSQKYGHWGLRRLSNSPKVTQLGRIQTRSHLTLEPRRLTDTLVIFTILCAEDIPRILPSLKILIQPTRVGPRDQHLNPPIIGISRHVVTQNTIYNALHFTFWMCFWGENYLVFPKHFKMRSWLMIIKIFPT